MRCFNLEGAWRNDACIGYCLLAMRRADVDEDTIRQVLQELIWCFDDTSVEQAAACGMANGGVTQ